MEEIPKPQASPRPATEQSATTAAPPQTTDPEVQLHTYHCICTNLVLATARSLSTVSRRAPSAQDKALILPSPPLPRRLVKHMRAHAAGDDEQQDSSESEQDDELDEDDAAGGKADASMNDLVLPVSMPRAAGPTMVRREDGFEKRWLMRCARCRLVVGYQLDWGQFGAAGGDGDREKGEGRKGRRDDIMYILPGALRTTEEMVLAKKVPDDEVGFGLAESGT